MNDLIVSIPEEKTLAVFVTPKGLDPYLEHIKNEVYGFVADVSTRKGRDEVASIAHKISRSKTALDAVGKQLVDRLKEQPKLVDAERKRMRDYLDALRDDVRRPLTEWEEAEEARVNLIKSRIHAIKEIGDSASNQTSSAIIAPLIYSLELIVIDESFAEFLGEAIAAKEVALTHARKMLESAEQQEEQAAELARLRAESEARAKEERERKIAEEAAAKAKQEAEESAKQREIKLKMEAEKAKRQKLEAEERARSAEFEAQEKVRIEKERAEADRVKREKDANHKLKIEAEAIAGLVAAGVPEGYAILAISSIACKEIEHVSISY